MHFECSYGCSDSDSPGEVNHEQPSALHPIIVLQQAQLVCHPNMLITAAPFIRPRMLPRSLALSHASVSCHYLSLTNFFHTPYSISSLSVHPFVTVTFESLLLKKCIHLKVRITSKFCLNPLLYFKFSSQLQVWE